MARHPDPRDPTGTALKAFGCDLCDRLETGSPAQELNVKPSMGAAVPLELCSQCLVSFNDWRVSRAPKCEQPSREIA